MELTNEKLIKYIRQGGNDDLIPLLWERNKKLLFMFARRYYTLNTEYAPLCLNLQKPNHFPPMPHISVYKSCKMEFLYDMHITFDNTMIKVKESGFYTSAPSKNISDILQTISIAFTMYLIPAPFHF